MLFFMDPLFHFSFDAMGGPCSLHLHATSSVVAGDAAERAMAEVARIERRYSRYRPDSLLSAINRAAAQGDRIRVDEETTGLLDYAYACYVHSNGLFDISSGVLRKGWDFDSGQIPSLERIAALLTRVGLDKTRWISPWLEFTVAGMEIDFGGIAKEYAADRAGAVCVDAGVEHGLIELGGDIHVIGPHPDGSPWAVGIRHPRVSDTLTGTIDIYRGGFAGSGDYARCMVLHGERFSHLLDPTTGWPVSGLAAVNVQAQNCMVAGSISTIAMLKGGAGSDWLCQVGLPYLWIDEAGRSGGPLLEGTHWRAQAQNLS